MIKERQSCRESECVDTASIRTVSFFVFFIVSLSSSCVRYFLPGLRKVAPREGVRVEINIIFVLRD